MAQRSCAGCKKKGEKSEFIRLCMKGDKLIIDEKHSEDGRGDSKTSYSKDITQ